MARPRTIEKEELRHMLRVRRLTHAEIAKETGLKVSTVRYYVRKYDLAGKQLNHKEAVPWTVAEKHAAKVYKYLVDLSATGQGKDIGSDMKNTALNWANRLVAQNKDIDYDREMPPNDESIVGGFYAKPADPENWHLKKVLNKANNGPSAL